MWVDESEAVAPIIWLYQTVDAQKEEVFFSDLLITLRSYVAFILKLGPNDQIHERRATEYLCGLVLFLSGRC